ncbi:carbohydrate ABC transporter permease [Streptomyces sp. NPDC050560]|uniref:carbohydrate ABC transporter permease n=1 Tax=Streptomyces sp. NPDC050560 TaxID=3365630 RepID=UPI003798AA0D
MTGLSLEQPGVRSGTARRRGLTPQRATFILRWVVIVAFGLAMGFPLLYLFSSSLMSATDVSAYPPHLLPPSIDWGNYADAYTYLTGRTIANTFIYALGILVLQLVITLPAGFALAKIRFRGAPVILALLVVPMFLPTNVVLVPLYAVTQQLGLIGDYPGMIIPVVGRTAFGTLLFRQFFLSLPTGLIEAARLDGAGWFRTLWSIAAPLARPAIAAYASITFLNAWNDYIWPLISAPDDAHRVMSVALAPLANGQLSNIPPNVGLAAAVISTVPVLLAFLFAQRWYVQGIVGTGVDY